MYVIGTAGHVDHGKSTLVHVLTGIDPDRLAEEKVREMTIDLGFAWLKLPSGREIGVIDVPGHEHFIKNMLAGVSGMDLVLLVIAANESIKPQTREHLAILDLMEVPRAIIVITQADTVDQDQIALVGMEVEDLVRPTRFANEPVVAVSSVTGQGLPDLKMKIDHVLNDVHPRSDFGRPRLPIDRVFTISGSGTVVTGTLIDGGLSLDQEVEIIPSGLKSRVRGLQTHKAQLDKVTPGSRVAVNLVGLSAADLKRGDMLTRPGWLLPTTLLDAKLRVLSQLTRPLRHNTEVSFHTGSAEVMARIRLLEKEEVQPGETTWVQFVLAQPLAAVNNDHYVIRSPMETLGGGSIIETHPARRHQRFRPEIIENLKIRCEGKLDEIILATLKNQQPLERGKLFSRINMDRGALQAATDSLVRWGQLVAIGEGVNCLLFTDSAWERLKQNILTLLKDYHRAYPLRSGMPKAELANKVKLGPSFQPALQKLITEKSVTEKLSLVSLIDFEKKFSPAQLSHIDNYLQELSKTPYSPAPETILEPDLLNLLIEKGQIVQTAPGIVFSTEAYEEMTSKILVYIKLNGKINLAEVRDMFQSSRKYAQAILEHLDEKKYTRRIGDDRVLGEKIPPDTSK